jgi:hypothetical protein
MKQKSSKTFDLTCPCCQATLTVDAALQAIVAHEAPPEKKPHMEVDLGGATKRLQDEAAKRDDAFRQSFEAHKKQSDVLARKFEESFKKVKDQPIEKPQRDIDLD